MPKNKWISLIEKWLNGRYVFWILLFIAFLLYGNTIRNYYSLDDVFVIHNNKTVQKGIKAIPEIFTTRYFENNQAKFGYRPLTKAVFAIEVSLFGVNPHVSHFINVVLFALMSYFTFIFLKRVFNNSEQILLVGLSLILYMFHPIHTEVVASLKNREEILYFLLTMWSGIFFLDFIAKNTYWRLMVAICLYCLSFLAKQSAISFLLVFPFVFYYKYLIGDSLKSLIDVKSWFVVSIRRNILLSSFCLFIAGYVMYKLPMWMFPPDELELMSFENPLRFNHELTARLSLALYALLYYLRLLFFPHPLLFYYGLYTIPEVGFDNFWVWVSILVHVIIFYFIMKYRKQNPYLLFGFAFYFLAILPFSNYFIEINGIVAERFLHGPSLGFAVATASFFYYVWTTDKSRVRRYRNRVKWLFLILLAFYTIKTVDRNKDWRSEMTLFANDIKYLDNSVKANDIIAQAIMDRIMQNNPLQKPFSELKPSLDSIIYYYQRSLELYPENPKALNNIANIYINFYNQPEKALEYLLKAYKYKPDNFELNFNMAQCYEMLKKDSLAMPHYRKALMKDKRHPRLWQNIINLFFKSNMLDSALNYAEQMLKYDSITDIPYTSIGYYYFLKKDTSTAVKYWEEAFRKNPTNYQRALSLAQYFASKNDTIKAKYYFQQAKSLAH